MVSKKNALANEGCRVIITPFSLAIHGGQVRNDQL